MHVALVIFHVLGACVWTGGHLVLATTILPRALREGRVDKLEEFESAYECIGIPALLVQIVTGFWLAFRHVPDPAAWFAMTDTRSTLIGVKVILLVTTLGLAMHARLRVLPELDPGNLRKLAWHIVPVTIISVAYVPVGVFIRWIAAGG